VDGIQKRLGTKAKVSFSDGKDVAEAVALAKSSDVAIVMVGMTRPKDGPFTDTRRESR